MKEPQLRVVREIRLEMRKMQNRRLSDLARALGNHLVQASRFKDEEPELSEERDCASQAGPSLCAISERP